MGWILLLVSLLLACYLIRLLGKLLWLSQLKRRWRSAKAPRKTMKDFKKKSGRHRNKRSEQ